MLDGAADHGRVADSSAAGGPGSVADMLRELPPARRRLALTVVGALLLVVLVGVGAVVVRSLGASTPVAQDRPGTVIAVAGYGGGTAGLKPIVDTLRAQGRRVLVLRPSAGGTGDLRVQARRLADLARREVDAGAPSVDVVGYSAGGVVARLFVRDEGGADVVRRVLTLGSPHHGTDVAALAAEAVGSCPTACEQLVPESDLLRRLDAGDETPAGPAWVTVRSHDDTTVTPVDSAELAGALNLLVQDFCPSARTGHGDLPGDPVTLAALAGTLGPEPPTRPSDVRC